MTCRSRLCSSPGRRATLVAVLLSTSLAACGSDAGDDPGSGTVPTGSDGAVSSGEVGVGGGEPSDNLEDEPVDGDGSNADDEINDQFDSDEDG